MPNEIWHGIKSSIFRNFRKKSFKTPTVDNLLLAKIPFIPFVCHPDSDIGSYKFSKFQVWSSVPFPFSIHLQSWEALIVFRSIFSIIINIQQSTNLLITENRAMKRTH